jgi:hypothetical protein
VHREDTLQLFENRRGMSHPCNTALSDAGGATHVQAHTPVEAFRRPDHDLEVHELVIAIREANVDVLGQLQFSHVCTTRTEWS